MIVVCFSVLSPVPRIPDSVRNPREILRRKTGTLHNLYTHADKLLQLQSLVRQIVPGDVYVAAFDAGTLHLITPSSPLATRLKYNQKKLISLIRQRANYPVANIKVSVRPDPSPARPQARPAAVLSPASARHLASTAKYIEDAGLRKALIQLSNRGRRSR